MNIANVLKVMRPGTKISFYNVEAGDQRAYVTCLFMYIKSVVTVDLIWVSAPDPRFFSEWTCWKGDIMLSIALKVENGELGSPVYKVWPSP